jgi:hypothetical protein
VYANALTASAPPLPVGRGGATARICACVGRQVDSRRNEDDDHVFTPLIFTPLTLCLATRSGRSSAPADDDDDDDEAGPRCYGNDDGGKCAASPNGVSAATARPAKGSAPTIEDAAAAAAPRGAA